MTIYFIIIPAVCILAAWLLYPVLFPENEADRIHKAQQDALKRHAKAMKVDRERIAAYWRERGQVIKPMDATRYGAWVDETKEVS